MGYLMAIVAAMLLAYLAGLLSFKVKSRWCAACGTVKSCPRCAAWASPVGPQGLPDTGTTVDHPATERRQRQAVSRGAPPASGF